MSRADEKELPDSLKGTSFEKRKFKTMQTIGDGSCLLHAIYYAIDKDGYRNKNSDAKRALVKTQRKLLASDYRRLAERFKNGEKFDRFDSGHFDILFNENYRHDRITADRISRLNEEIITDPEQFLGLQIVNVIASQENKEIIIVDIDKGYSITNFKCYKNEKMKYNKVVFILRFADKKHFEPLVAKDELTDNYVGEFRIDSSIVKEILDVCEVNDEIYGKSGISGNYIDRGIFGSSLNSERKLRHNNVYNNPYKYNSNRRSNYTLFPSNYYTDTSYNTSRNSNSLSIPFSTIILIILIMIVTLILYSSYY